MRASLALACLAYGAAAQSASFTADISGPRANISTVTIDSFGSSHAATTLRKKWRDHFVATKAAIDFKRVRFHGILDDDMSSFLAPWGANIVLVSDTFDFLVEQGVAPTVEIGFMPSALAVNPADTTFHYRGGTSLPADWGMWRRFISNFTSLLLQRYGAPTVRSWKFETWNEANCNFLVPGNNGCNATSGNLTAYFELYDNTARAIKAVDPQLQVGGPATAQLAWIPAFLALVKAAGTPIDFVTTHAYPTDPLIPLNRDGFVTAVAGAAAQAGAGGLPLYLTEFNAGLSVQALSQPALDVSYAGAFLLHTHLGVQSVRNLASLSYWCFTEATFEEAGANPVPWDNKFGVRTLSGTPKPAFRALQFISEQPADAAVPVTPTGAGGGRQFLNLAGGVVGATQGTVDVSVTAQANAGGGVDVAALLCNFELIGQGGATAGVPAVTTVTLTFTGLAGTLPSSATLELYDATHGSGYATWLAAGSPLYPTAAEIAAELAASEAPAQAVPLAPAGSGAVSATVTLQPYAFARLRFTA